jgi:hypothetical protein
VGIHGSDEEDVVEHGPAPLRLPGWARRPRWLPTLGRRPSRGAAILGLAGLIVGLAAGYAVGYRHLGQIVRPLRPTAPGAVTSLVPGAVAPLAPAVSPGGSGAVTSLVPGSVAPLAPAVPPGGSGAYSSGLSVAGLSGLAQSGGECSVQRGRDLQVGLEVINLSGTPVILGQVTPILPLGGLRLLSQQWAPCGAIVPAGEAAGGGSIVFIGASTGEVEAGNGADAAVLPPYGSAWLSVTFRVLMACPAPLPVLFSVWYQENGRTDTAQLPGFSDLGQVPYTGCKGNS